MPFGFFYVFVGLHSDNPGPVCPDSGTWIEGDHTVADRANLEEQATLEWFSRLLLTQSAREISVAAREHPSDLSFHLYIHLCTTRILYNFLVLLGP